MAANVWSDAAREAALEARRELHNTLDRFHQHYKDTVGENKDVDKGIAEAKEKATSHVKAAAILKKHGMDDYNAFRHGRLED